MSADVAPEALPDIEQRIKETPAERAAHGKEARKRAPRSAHADWKPAADRPDAVALLEQQALERAADLVPIRYGRMLASPAAFYPSAGWAGKTIAWDEGVFTHEAYGMVTAHAVMSYDVGGQLDWATDGMRAWVVLAIVFAVALALVIGSKTPSGDQSAGGGTAADEANGNWVQVFSWTGGPRPRPTRQRIVHAGGRPSTGDDHDPRGARRRLRAAVAGGLESGVPGRRRRMGGLGPARLRYLGARLLPAGRQLLLVEPDRRLHLDDHDQ